MVKVSDLRTRDVVNVVDGKRLGNIKDIDLDVENGKIRALILPGNTGRMMGFLGRSEDLIVPWENIKTIGVDVILVELKGFAEVKHF